jgi:hypothetical protein
MQLKGTHTFQAPRLAVWEALLDPLVLAQALPGGEQLEKTGENEYKAVLNVKIGPVQGRFEGKVELTDIQAPEGYHMKVSGSGPAGFVNGAGAIQLNEAGEGALLNYEGDVQVGGKIAGVGQRLIDSTAKAMIKQGLKVLDDQIQARLAPPPAPPAPVVAETPAALVKPLQPEATAGAPTANPATPSAPTPFPAVAPPPPSSRAAPSLSPTKMALEVAKEVARDLASDYIPPEHHEKAFYAALGALAMLLFVILVRLVQSRD